jgi:protocatechuate 3,4-dioxygenase beta subunit
LDPGPVTVVVRAPGFQVENAQVVVTPVEAEAAPVLVQLKTGGIVAGHVFDEDGTGVSGVRIAMVAESDPNGFAYGRTFTESGHDGAFRVDTLPTSGDLILIAAVRGYPTAFHKAKAGQVNVAVVLRRGATLDVQVVRGERSEPVEGAQVLLALGKEGGGFGGDPQGLATGVTDRTGRVTFDVAPGYIQMAFINHPDHAGGMWAAGAETLPGLLEGPEDHEIRAGRQEVVFRLGDAVIVTGTVRGPDGTPVPGARVSSLVTFQMINPAVTDAEGHYRVAAPRVPGGNLMLLVAAEGFVQDQASSMVSGEPDEKGEIVHDFTLQRAAVVTGRVVSPEGQAMAGVRVRVRGGGAGDLGFGMFRPIEGLSGRDGRYVIDGVSPGEEMYVIARHPGFVDSATEAFAVAQGGAVRAPDLVLSRGARLALTVTDPDDRPLGGADVSVSLDRAASIQWDVIESFQEQPDLTTDATGRVLLDRLAPGRVTITVRHEDFAGSVQHVEVKTDGAPPPLRMALRPAATVTGIVLDEAGMPVKDAWVRATGTDVVGVNGRSSEDGTFRLEPLPPQPLVLHVSASGYRDASFETLAPASGLQVTLVRPDPASTERLQELQRRIGEISQAFQNATGPEREALQEEMQALFAEMETLQGEGTLVPTGDGDVVEVIEVAEPEIEEIEEIDEAEAPTIR